MLSYNTQRKGVTPVIAIVLLLTVTIGAVGILYTQVGDLLEQDDGFDDIDRVQDTEIEVRSGVEINEDANDEHAGNLGLVVYNSGERALSFEDEFHMEINGVEYETADTIFDGEPAFDRRLLEGTHPDGDSVGCLSGQMNLDISQSTDGLDLNSDGEEVVGCDTGVEFPSAFDDEVEIRFLLEGSSRTWSYECNPSSDEDGFC